MRCAKQPEYTVPKHLAGIKQSKTFNYLQLDSISHDSTPPDDSKFLDHGKDP